MKPRKTRPVTTGGAGYIPPVVNVPNVRKTLYERIDPYDSYNLVDFVKHILYPRKEMPRDKYVEDATTDYNLLRDGYFVNQTGEDVQYAKELLEHEILEANIADELFANYLNIPLKARHTDVRLKPSKYKMGSYSLPLDEWHIEGVINHSNDLDLNKNKSSTLLAHTGLYRHALGRGYDSKGEYRSYGDSYDMNPFRGAAAILDVPYLNKKNDLSLGFGNPIEIYDRIYLDDYYGVSEPTHSTWLPEVTIRPRKK